MTKAAKEFNLKYNLNVSDSSFEKVDFNNYITEDLSGKIKKNWKESLKRFFGNPVYLVSFLLFIGIVITSLVIKYSSPFSDKETVLPGDIINSHWMKDLPASGTKVVDTLSLTDIKKLNNFGVNANHYEVILQGVNSTTIKWDPWEYVNAISKKYGGTNFESIMGTDSVGRDFWTRTWSATVHSLTIAISIAIITTVIGSLLGSFIGMYPGTIYDIIFMKILALYNSVPTVVWYAIILGMFNPGVTALFVVLIVTGWQRGFAISRMYMWKYINSGFMESATTMGVSKFNRIVKHALPNYLGMIAYGFVGAIPGIIEATASIAFLGFAINPEAADLGNSLNEIIKLSSNVSVNIWKIILPTFIIFGLTISLQFCAMGINDALDPRYKKRGN